MPAFSVYPCGPDRTAASARSTSIADAGMGGSPSDRSMLVFRRRPLIWRMIDGESCSTRLDTSRTSLLLGQSIRSTLALQAPAFDDRVGQSDAHDAWGWFLGELHR